MIDIAHTSDLLSPFLDVILVDVHCVDPHQPNSSPRPDESQHPPAVAGLEQDIPMRPNKYGTTKRVVAIFASPSIRDGFVFGAVVAVICLKGKVDGGAGVSSGKASESKFRWAPIIRHTLPM